MDLKGQVSLSNLQRYVIAFVVIGVVGAIGLDVMGSVQSNMYNSLSVENETFNATSNPYTHTVAEAGDTNFYELNSVTCYDTVDQGTEITCSITDASAGEVQIDAATDTEDETISYSYMDEDTQAREGADQAISGMNELLGFLPVIGLVIAAVVVIGLVSGFGGSGRRRGRA